MVSLRELFEVDPAEKKGEKGYLRAQRIVTHMRQSMVDIVDRQRARENKSYLFGLQDMREIKEMFRDPKKAGIKFWQLATMEKMRNVIIAEEENNGLHFELKAVDATATNKKVQDQLLIQNRGWIDATMTQINKAMGLPAYNMLKEKGLFSGNVDQMDKMGLDSSNLQDLNYFFTQHYRLLEEMVGEEPVNYFIQYNELDEMIPLLLNDAMAVKACALQSYVSETSGAVEYKYIAAENIKAVPGKRRRDYKDASALGYEQSMSIQDFIKLVGNDFDYERDMPELLRAVNSNVQEPYTGILIGTKIYYGTPERCIDYGNFLRYQVSVGYIEWKEMDASAHKFTKNNKKGQFGLRPTSVTGELSANSTYEKDVRYCETTYKSYYLSFGAFSQRLYKWGKLTYQPTEGAEDEYSGFSIIVNQEIGKSAVEVAMPWVELVEKAFKKMEWMIVRAKAPGRGLNYESMLDIGRALFPGKPPGEQINAVMAMFAESSNEIFTLPKVNGQVIGGGSQSNYDIPNGVSKAVMDFKMIVDWATEKIMDSIGISPMRSVYQPGERDAVGLQEGVNNYSEKATQYLHKMIVRTVKNVGIRTLAFVQDIIEFKDVNSLPYKFLENAVGEGTMAMLKGMGNTRFHRYGIFVRGLNNAADKQQQRAILLQALGKGDINYEQYLLISDIDSPKKAMMVLAYEKLRTERVNQQNQMQTIQAQQQLEDKKHSNKMAEIQLEGTLGNERENTRGYWYAKGQEIAASAKLLDTNQKLNNSPEAAEVNMANQIKSNAAAPIGGAAPVDPNAPPGGPAAPQAPQQPAAVPPQEQAAMPVS